MKKSFVIASALFLSLGTIVKAQDSIKVAAAPGLHRVEFGFRFMPTFSSFQMQTSSGGTVKGEVTLGYGVGGMLAVNLTSHVAIQGEILYSSLSQKYVDQDLEREINLRYINIPLLFELNTGKANPVNLNVVCGPQIGYNVGSSMSSAGSGSTDTVTTVFAAKQTDFGLAYGAGLDFLLNSTRTIRLDVGFRGVYGFTNVSNTSKANPDGSYYILDGATIRTNSAYVGITFLF